MYSNLHEYLDKHLPESPSDQQIKKCKKKYWKWYRTEHRKKRVTEAKALNLTISRDLWKHLKARAHTSHMNIYDFIKRNLETGLEPNIEMNIRFTIELMQCLELLKECTHGEATIDQVIVKMEQILLRL